MFHVKHENFTHHPIVYYICIYYILRNFLYCNNKVKCSLFKSFCTNMYCCTLWFNSTSSSVKKLKCSHNSVCIRMPYSASAIFVTHGIPFIYELLRKCIYNFSERISSSSNSIICIFSPMHKTLVAISTMLALVNFI